MGPGAGRVDEERRFAQPPGVAKNENAEGEVVGGGKDEIDIFHEFGDPVVRQPFRIGRHPGFGIDPKDRLPQDLRLFPRQRIGEAGDLTIHVGGAVDIEVAKNETLDAGTGKDHGDRAPDASTADDQNPRPPETLLLGFTEHAVVALKEFSVIHGFKGRYPSGPGGSCPLHGPRRKECKLLPTRWR